ncbi:MAG: FHA domain-containing protein [Methylacidiphilales bacterium]|nr:FHA domain-containing protein [Candidatus Methylacidiphilales bacterium]
MPRLIVKSPEFEGQIFELNGTKLTVGRTEDNSIHIRHPSVSSHHAELRLEGGDYKLVDLNSTNGTRVNDERATETMLRNQDLVMFGNILLAYQTENVMSAPPLPGVASRVRLAAGGATSCPATFVNLAPFPRKRMGTGGFPVLILLGVLIALGGAGYLAYQIFMG